MSDQVGSRFDATLVRRWLGIIHGDAPGLLHIAATDNWAGQIFPTNQLDDAAAYVAAMDAQDREGIYARISTLRAPVEPGKRGGAADTLALPALWADLDLAGPGHVEANLPPDEEAGRKVIATSGLPEPSIWIHSGGGMYPIWLLDTPHAVTDDLADVKDLAAGWQKVIAHAAQQLGWKYGTGVGDLARVLRIPGTINRKEGLARPCRIISAKPNRYPIQALYEALAAGMAAIPTPTSTPHTAVAAAAHDGVSPGDDYAARVDWADILTPHGWTLSHHQDQTRFWTRPGKRHGISATTNFLGTDRLHVFSTSTAFDADASYSKFGAYTILEHHGDHSAAAKALRAAGFGTPLPDPAEEQRAAFRELLGDQADARLDQAEAPPAASHPHDLDVTNPATALAWLRNTIGSGALAGLFHRSDNVVFIAREGESGYIPPDREGDDDGPAQVRLITPASLASYIDARYRCFRWIKQGEDFDAKPALFPLESAKRTIELPDPQLRPGLRRLAGVVHTPIVRADGSVLDTPGYDRATRLYFLPAPDLIVPPVPDHPTPEQIRNAVGLLDEMTAGFPWKSDHDQANFYGFLLTPLVRNLAPIPFKLFIFDAPQQGTGKTLLADLGRILHGGVLRGGVQHNDDAEVHKIVTTVLARTTGPVVVLDNLTGTLDSPVLAGLLTSPEWSDRLLGGNEEFSAANDRVWCVTANNLTVGVDMVRRVIWTGIDAQTARPQDRTDFAISDLPSWTREHRGALLHALLTVIRAWVAAGRPVRPARSSDCFARWMQTIDGILVHAGVAGQFADQSTTRQETGADDDEWGQFLAAARSIFGDASWTAKELLACIPTTFGGLAPSIPTPGQFPVDALPGDLSEKATRHPRGPVGIAKSLGRWLNNRDGRFVGRLSARAAGNDGHGVKRWRVVLLSAESPSGFTGLSGFTGAISARATTTQLQGVVERVGVSTQSVSANPDIPVNPGDGSDG